MKNKKQTEYRRIAAVLAVAVAASVSLWRNGYAENGTNSISELEKKQEAEKKENDEKLAELEKRAQMYREIIEIKQRQQNSLNNQLSTMDAQLEEVETEIELNKRKIDELDHKIKSLQQQIADKEKTLAFQKRVLSELVQSYYKTSQENILNVVFTEGNFAAFMSRKSQLAQASGRIKEMVDSVASIREKLLADRNELDKKRVAIVDAHYELADKNAALENKQEEKKTLLEQTKGEEARYQQLLARVEEQKLELLNIDDLYATSGLSIDDFPKPEAKYAASMDWFYSQKDPRWASVNIGNSKSDMKNWGCAVTAVAMVAKFHGDGTLPGALAKKPIYSFDLIKWQLGEWNTKIALAAQFGTAHGNINWGEIDNQIKKKHPVIVYLKKANGKGGHYAVIHTKTSNGKYVVHDPYFGPNIFLDTSKALVGAMGSPSGILIDQMIIYN